MEKIRNKRRFLLLAGLGALLIVGSSLLGTLGSRKAEETAFTDVGFYTEYLEKRITELCRSLEGVAEAQVFLTLDCSSEYVYQEDGSSDFLILSDASGEQAVMLCEIYPKVRGIAVVCTGGDLPRVKETVTELLSAALGLPSNRIRVAGGGSGILSAGDAYNEPKT